MRITGKIALLIGIIAFLATSCQKDMPTPTGCPTEIGSDNQRSGDPSTQDNGNGGLGADHDVTADTIVGGGDDSHDGGNIIGGGDGDRDGGGIIGGGDGDRDGGSRIGNETGEQPK